jgi:hypothetical protein
MATTATCIKSTPYSAVYRLTTNGVGVGSITIDYSTAPDIGVLVPGPYKYQIKKMLGALDKLNLDTVNTDPRSRRVRIYTVSGFITTETPSGHYTIEWVPNGLQVALIDEAPADLLIEVRFIHSSRR